MKTTYCQFSWRLNIVICVLLLTSFPCIPAFSASPYQIPLKEMFSKKPMKLDSAFKSRAVKVKVRRRNGISSMVRYNYDEYTTEDAKHKAVRTSELEYGFILYAGNRPVKPGSPMC